MGRIPLTGGDKTFENEKVLWIPNMKYQNPRSIKDADEAARWNKKEAET